MAVQLFLCHYDDDSHLIILIDCRFSLPTCQRKEILQTSGFVIINFYPFALFVKIRWVSLNKAFFSVCSSRSDIRNTNVARSISFTGIVSHSWSIFNDGYLRKNVFKNLKDFYKLKYFLKTRFVLK